MINVFAAIAGIVFLLVGLRLFLEAAQAAQETMPNVHTDGFKRKNHKRDMMLSGCIVSLSWVLFLFSQALTWRT